jgi:8-oxo-dGTP pyrophosphatase MutT (NUDIX family)
MDPQLRADLQTRLSAFDRQPAEDTGLRAAAVAVVVVRGHEGQASFVMTRRATSMRKHAGQWALPGGRLDEGEDPISAALRETHEEVCLECGPEQVLGLLDDYPTRSGFVITPVVVWGGDADSLAANPDEVAEVHRVPLTELEQPEVPVLRTIPESDRPVISIPMLGTQIHAPTAAILYQLREVALRGLDTRVAHFEQPVFAWR